MSDIKVTSGYNFEGYEITEYLGLVSGQTVFGSNFFKGIAAGVTEVSDTENEKFTAKLEQLNEIATERLLEQAKRIKADAVIGINLSYPQFANNSVGTVASGTAVKLKKLVNDKKNEVTELYISNYYKRKVPRPVKLILHNNDGQIDIETWYYNYKKEDIKAIRVDIEMTNLYDEKLIMNDMDFVFKKGNISLIKSVPISCNLSAMDIALIKDVKVYVSKFVTSNGVFVCEEESIDITMPLHHLKLLKENKGIDAVEKYRTDGLIWTCNCGYVNEAGATECVVCSRKQENIKEKAKFNHEEMINKMKTKEYVLELKDILMEYIKDIDSKYRMELLEIMESGIQYEKTRGNMKDTVIEKVEKVFE